MDHLKTGYSIALASGAIAGLCVDIVLYPLDTVKTRLQSAQGFRKAGGFSGIYRGIGSTAVGSVPGAALFFTTYETVKAMAVPHDKSSNWLPVSHMLAASCGETVACFVRVPTEVVKQRAMTSKTLSSFAVFTNTVRSEGVLGLYRGYFSTVMREVPFSLIQFPIWEYLKRTWSSRQGHPVAAWQSSVCGALAGGIAAGVTTPLDVAKTRIMLADVGSDIAKGNIWAALLAVRQQKGIAGLFSGVVPRVTWISIGGAIFLGIYDKVRNTLCSAT